LIFGATGEQPCKLNSNLRGFTQQPVAILAQASVVANNGGSSVESIAG
jgi:hypothetical protein